MLREFEDQENLLSEMDEQVDAYRDSGKVEAAKRLEDQLLLIHQRFQELQMKFELFQESPSAIDYEPRLDRVHRQLRDIRHKMQLTKVTSIDSHVVKEQLHHVGCVYNALSDIKPEVENVIKMGRRVVADSSERSNAGDLTSKIDRLKEDFNDLGGQVSAYRPRSRARAKACRGGRKANPFPFSRLPFAMRYSIRTSTFLCQRLNVFPAPPIGDRGQEDVGKSPGNERKHSQASERRTIVAEIDGRSTVARDGMGSGRHQLYP